MEITFIITSAFTFIGIVTTTVFSILNWRNSRKVNYINSINSERRQWLANIRSSFIKQLEATYEIYVQKSEGEISSFEIKNTEMWLKIYSFQNESYLLLNPNEAIVQHLIKLYNEEKDILFSADINDKMFLNKHDEIVLTQQIILKTEWKIIKEETRIGRELNDIEKKEILLKTTKKFDLKVYLKLKKNRV